MATVNRFCAVVPCCQLAAWKCFDDTLRRETKSCLGGASQRSFLGTTITRIMYGLVLCETSNYRILHIGIHPVLGPTLLFLNPPGVGIARAYSGGQGDTCTWTLDLQANSRWAFFGWLDRLDACRHMQSSYLGSFTSTSATERILGEVPVSSLAQDARSEKSGKTPGLPSYLKSSIGQTKCEP